jgi:hypothetical protein
MRFETNTISGKDIIDTGDNEMKFNNGETLEGSSNQDFPKKQSKFMPPLIYIKKDTSGEMHLEIYDPKSFKIKDFDKAIKALNKIKGKLKE